MQKWKNKKFFQKQKIALKFFIAKNKKIENLKREKKSQKQKKFQKQNFAKTFLQIQKNFSIPKLKMRKKRKKLIFLRL